MFARMTGSGWMSRSRYLGWLLVLAAAGCAITPDVRTNSAPGVDFKQFRTFSFLPSLSTDRAGYHTLVSQQLTFSTRRELEVRGLQFVADSAQADVLVNFHADVSEQLRVRSVPDPWVGQSYWNHRRGILSPLARSFHLARPILPNRSRPGVEWPTQRGCDRPKTEHAGVGRGGQSAPDAAHDERPGPGDGQRRPRDLPPVPAVAQALTRRRSPARNRCERVASPLPLKREKKGVRSLFRDGSPEKGI